MPAFVHDSSSSSSSSAPPSPSPSKSRPIASSSGWIQSEQRPSSAASIQTLLLPKRVLEQAPKPKRQSSSGLTRKSASPTRFRQSVLFPDASAMTKKTDTANAQAGGSQAATSKGKDKDRDSEALDAIRAKVSQFQPKINAMLPRMMDKGAADNKTPAEAPPSKSQKIAEKAPTLSKAHNAPTETPASTSFANVKRAPASTTVTGTSTSSSSSKPAAASTPVSVKPTMTLKTSKGKKEPAAQSTSIADLIPKGSRTKPLAQKSSSPTHQSKAPGPSRQPETDTAVIVLSSSLPSSPMDEDSITIDNSDEPDAAGKAADSRVHMSIATVDSSLGSDSAGNTLPSIEVHNIARWMGGVHEAMQQEEMEKNDLNAFNHPDTTYTRQVVTDGSRVSTTTTVSTKAPEQAASKMADSSRRSTLRRPPQPLKRDANLARPPPILEVLSSSLPEESLNSDFEPMEDVLQEHAPQQQQKLNVATRVLAKDSLPTHVAREDTERLLDDLSVNVGTIQESEFPSLPSFLYKKDDDEMVDSLAVREDEEAYYRRNMVEEVEETLDPTEAEPIPEPAPEPASEQAQKPALPPVPSLPSLPSELTASCLEELGLKRKNSMERSERKKRMGSHLSKSFLGGLQEEQDEDEETSPILAQPYMDPSSFGLALSTTASPLPHASRPSGPATRESPRRSIIIGSGGSEMVVGSGYADDGSLMLMEEAKYVPLEIPRRVAISRNDAQQRRRLPVPGSNEDEEEEEEHEQLEDHEQSLYNNHPTHGQRGMDDDPTFSSPPSLNFSFSTLPSMPSLPSFSSSQTLPSMQPSTFTLQSEPSLVMLSTLDDDSTQPSRLRPQERQE